VLATRWRQVAGFACCVIALWAVWTGVDGSGRLVISAVVAVPALLVLRLAPSWRIGVPTVGFLMVALVALQLLSTHRSDALQPPPNDWLVPYLALTLVGGILMYAFRLKAAAPDQRKMLLLGGAGVLVVLICLGAILSGGPGGALPGSGGDLSVSTRDYLPFPDGVEAQGIGYDCDTGSGVCSRTIEIWSASGRPATEVADQVAGRLRAVGWPMKATGMAGRQSACLPIRGVFQWAARACASTFPSADLTWPARMKPHERSVVLAFAASPDALPIAPA
jgi:hypothetical protein